MTSLVPYSPEWWLVRLDAQLEARRHDVELYERYYDGDHPLAFATDRFKKTFGGLFEALADNWCEIVVDAAVERMKVEGFRFGDTTSDDEAWEIWQANGLDAGSIMAHTTAVTCGEAYAMVTPGGTERRGLLRRQKPRTPIITIEVPAEVIVETLPGQPLVRLAALKKWTDLDGQTYANVFLPDRVCKFRAVTDNPRVVIPATVDYDAVTAFGRAWAPHPTEPVVENPIGVVPIIPLVNKPRARGGRGRSDLAPVRPLQDVVNKILADGIITSEFSSFFQRWATGIQTHDEETDEPLDMSRYLSAADTLWADENEKAKFGAFPASDLKPTVVFLEMIVSHIAAHTRTPPHYMMGEIVNANADTLKAAETGLVARVDRKKVDIGEAWEETERVSFAAMGNDEKARMTRAETIWGDSESRSDAQRVDAALKMRDLEVPRSAVWRKIGASEQEIKDWRAEREQEDRVALLAGFGGFDPDPRAPNVPPERDPAED